MRSAADPLSRHTNGHAWGRRRSAASSLSTVWRISIGCARTPPLAIMNPPAPALEADDLRVMQKSIEERARGGGVAQHLAPVLDGSVGRDQNGSGLIAAGEDLQQVLRRGGRQTPHAEILDH